MDSYWLWVATFGQMMADTVSDTIMIRAAIGATRRTTDIITAGQDGKGTITDTAIGTTELTGIGITTVPTGIVNIADPWLLRNTSTMNTELKNPNTWS